MSSPSVHHGSCHCGAVQFDVELALEGLLTCNCSICGRSGAIMAFVPFARLTGIKGADHLTDYQFGGRNIHHAFCSTCGMRPYGWGTGQDGSAYAMVNVRCLEGVDVHTLKIDRQYDGKSL